MKRYFSKALLLCFLALFLIAPDPAWAVKFGKVTVDSVSLYETHENTRRGYAGYLFQVRNNDTKPHTVQVKIPSSSYSYGMSSLVSNTRTCKLSPGQTTHLWIYQPAITMQDRNALVTIDRHPYKDRLVEFNVQHESLYSDSSGYGAHSYGSPSGSFPGGGTPPMTSPAAELPVEEVVVEEVEAKETEGTEEKKEATDKTESPEAELDVIIEEEVLPLLNPGMGGPTTAAAGSPAHTDASIAVLASRGLSGNLRDQLKNLLFDCNMILSAQKTSLWPTNWIAYSQFDGVILTDKEFGTLPSETVSALADYASVGGTVWVRPSKKSRSVLTKEMKKVQQAAANGLGTFLRRKRDARNFKEQTIVQIRCTNSLHDSSEAARLLPAIKRNATPVRLFLVMLIFYALLIGPALQFLLKVKRRRIWMLWIIPLASIVLCLVVFIGSYLAEGFNGYANFRNITVLDQTAGRASTIGWASFYSPLSDGAGLTFSTATVLQPQWKSRGYRYGRGRNDEQHDVSIDWTAGQHLTSGWLQAKTPLTFRLWKAEQRREKLTIRKDDSGKFTVTNALGADADGLQLRMPDGKWYTTERLSAGETRTLNQMAAVETRIHNKMAASTHATLPTVKDYCQNASNWHLQDHDKRTGPRTKLPPGTYQVMLDGHPFVNTAITNPAKDQGKTLVFGRFVVE